MASFQAVSSLNGVIFTLMKQSIYIVNQGEFSFQELIVYNQ